MAGLYEFCSYQTKNDNDTIYVLVIDNDVIGLKIDVHTFVALMKNIALLKHVI